MVNRVEALLDAIHAFNGAKDPAHAAYQARNPLCLQQFTETGEATGKIRNFESLHGGYLAGLYDLKIKCSGKSRAKLHGENFTIRGLMRAYNLKEETSVYIARFLRKALNDEKISETTRLDYFLSGVTSNA